MSSLGLFTAHTSLEVLTPCTGPAPGRHCKGTDNTHLEDVKAKGTSGINQADLGFTQAPSPRFGEPWHLRPGNRSPPTHDLRAKEDKSPSPGQRQETFIPAQGLTSIQGTGGRNLQQ